LEYRTVRFEEERIEKANYQGNAVVNYTDREVPYTRIIEHKHFESFGQAVYDNPVTIISKEYSTEWKEGMEPYYPVNDIRNNLLADKYRLLASKQENVIFGGRLAEYKYYDMAPVIEQVMNQLSN
jgi:UDP-galactopyranose mutase